MWLHRRRWFGGSFQGSLSGFKSRIPGVLKALLFFSSPLSRLPSHPSRVPARITPGSISSSSITHHSRSKRKHRKKKKKCYQNKINYTDDYGNLNLHNQRLLLLVKNPISLQLPSFLGQFYKKKGPDKIDGWPLNP